MPPGPCVCLPVTPQHTTARVVKHMQHSTPQHTLMLFIPRWVSLLEEELFGQGDEEKARGLPVSPLFDREKPGVTKSQVGGPFLGGGGLVSQDSTDDT